MLSQIIQDPLRSGRADPGHFQPVIDILTQPGGRRRHLLSGIVISWHDDFRYDDLFSVDQLLRQIDPVFISRTAQSTGQIDQIFQPGSLLDRINSGLFDSPGQLNRHLPHGWIRQRCHAIKLLPQSNQKNDDQPDNDSPLLHTFSICDCPRQRSFPANCSNKKAPPKWSLRLFCVG